MKPGNVSGVPKRQRPSSRLRILLKWRPGRRRIRREKKTVGAMLGLYCRDHHRGRERLCSECAELLDYAEARLDKCPFGEQKPKCAQCEIHCYRPEQRERITAVMRYAGPRMLKRHPILALLHLKDSLAGPRRAPGDSERSRSLSLL